MFLELLVAGFGGIVWFSFLVIIVFGPEPIVYLLQSGNLNGAIVLTMGIGSAYVIGILLDRAYFPVWRRIDDAQREKVGIDVHKYYEAQVQIATNGNDRLSDLLAFYTSRMRILRTSMINFLLMALLGLWAFWPYKITPWFILIVGLVLSIVSANALQQLTEKYYKKVVEAKVLIMLSDNSA